MLLSLGTGVILARSLGPHGRGVYAVSQIPVQLLSSILAQGISVAAVYLISGAHETNIRVLRSIIGISLVGSAALALAVTPLWPLLHGSVLKGTPFWVYVVANTAFPAYTWASIAQSYLFARGRTSASQVPQICERFASLAGFGAAAALGAGVMGMVAATSGAAFVGAACTLGLVGWSDVRSALRERKTASVTLTMLRYSSRLSVANVAAAHISTRPDSRQRLRRTKRGRLLRPRRAPGRAAVTRAPLAAHGVGGHPR